MLEIKGPLPIVLSLKEYFHVLSLYMDDIVLVENNMEMNFSIKEWLSFTNVKDMGQENFIFIVKILKGYSKMLHSLP